MSVLTVARLEPVNPERFALGLCVSPLDRPDGCRARSRGLEALRCGFHEVILCRQGESTILIEEEVLQVRPGTNTALLSSMAIVWIADVAAYFAGRAFGRRKLAPTISPGKSWEGAIGGFERCLDPVQKFDSDEFVQALFTTEEKKEEGEE